MDNKCGIIYIGSSNKDKYVSNWLDTIAALGQSRSLWISAILIAYVRGERIPTGTPIEPPTTLVSPPVSVVLAPPKRAATHPLQTTSPIKSPTSQGQHASPVNRDAEAGIAPKCPPSPSDSDFDFSDFDIDFGAANKKNEAENPQNITAKSTMKNQGKRNMHNTPDECVSSENLEISMKNRHRYAYTLTLFEAKSAYQKLKKNGRYIDRVIKESIINWASNGTPDISVVKDYLAESWTCRNAFFEGGGQILQEKEPEEQFDFVDFEPAAEQASFENEAENEKENTSIYEFF